MSQVRILSRGHVGLILVIALVVVLVGVLGWRAWATLHKSDTASTTGTTSSQDLKPVPAISSTDDLSTADADLGNLNLDDGDTSSLKSQLDY